METLTRKVKCPACHQNAQQFNVAEDESKIVCDMCLYEAWDLPPLTLTEEKSHQQIIGTVEEEARRAVDGKRQEDYGTPKENHGRTASLWRSYIQGRTGFYIGLDEQDVCNLNILQKMSREMNGHTRDGLVDQIGYVINIAKLRGYE